MNNLANRQRAAENAMKLLAKQFGGMAEFIKMTERFRGGYIPTIASAKVANAIKLMGFRCWNPATGQNW